MVWEERIKYLESKAEAVNKKIKLLEEQRVNSLKSSAIDQAQELFKEIIKLKKVKAGLILEIIQVMEGDLV